MGRFDLGGIGKIQAKLNEVADFSERAHGVVKKDGVYYVEFKDGSLKRADSFRHNDTIREIVRKLVAKLDQVASR